MDTADYGVTARLADYIVSTGGADLPEAVRHEAVRSFVNIVGCTVGGARHPNVLLADEALAPFAGQAQATLFGRGRRTDILHAALINCFASSIYGFDDTHAQAVVHPSGPVATAALALAELRPVAGHELLTAFALGVEMECRLCKAITIPPAKGSIAWVGTGITGGFGAVVASGKLLRLDATRMRHAIGIALSQAAGFRAVHGTNCTAMLPAHAAQTGLRAAMLAERGFSSSTAALEGRYGYLSVFCEEPDIEVLAGGLGERFELCSNTYKPYPCGIVIHPIIDACLKLRQDHAIPADRIAHVAIKASAGAMALCDRRTPRDEMEAHVSLYHWAAVAILRGTARMVDADTETAVRDPAVVAFRGRVDAAADQSLASDAAAVTLTMTDGTTLSCQIDHARGSLARPMTDAELDEKCLALAEPVIGMARARAIIERCRNIAVLPDAGDVPRAAA